MWCAGDAEAWKRAAADDADDAPEWVPEICESPEYRMARDAVWRCLSWGFAADPYELKKDAGHDAGRVSFAARMKPTTQHAPSPARLPGDAHGK